MSGKFVKKYIVEAILLAVILAFYAGHSLFVGSQVYNYATDDISMIHSEFIPLLAAAVSSGDPGNIFRCIQNMHYPPLYIFNGYLLATVLGKSWMLMNLVHNTFYLIMLLAFAYMLGSKVKDRVTGIISAVMLALLPPIYGTFTNFSIDFSVMSLTAVSMYLLYRSEMFKNTKWSLLLGLSCGLGMLTKDTFAVYIFGPALYALYRAYSRMFEEEYSSLGNIAVFAILAALVAFPYYLGESSMGWFLSGPFREATGLPWYSYANVRLLTIGISESLLSPPFFVVFVIGLFFFLRKETPSSLKWMVALWIIVPSVIILIVPHWKTGRYLMPLLPAYTLVAAYGARGIAGSKIGRILLLAVLLIGIAQYPSITFDTGLKLGTGDERVLPRFIRYFSYFDSNKPFYERLEVSRIKSAVYGAIEREMRFSEDRTTNIFVPYTFGGEIIYDTYFWFQGKNTKQYSFLGNAYTPSILGKYQTYENINDIKRYDYVVFMVRRKDDKGGEWLDLPFKTIEENLNKLHDKSIVNDKVLSLLESIWMEFKRSFPVRKRIYKDSYCSVYLYSRK